ncbi:TetR family transcriptional regulator [Clostridia bacterium]|nr:TetR family transcriptional regulator [Clostridia bacterium]
MPQTKRQAQKELTRQKIIDTAFRLYTVRGFATPTNTIAQEAGISHGAIFVHFPTREILQTCVLEMFTQKVGKKLHSLSVSGGDISDLLYAHIGVLEEYENFYKTLITELSTLPSGTKTMLISLQSIMSNHFGVVIEQGQQIGKFKNVPLHIVFNMWMGLLYYYLQNSDLFAPGGSVLKRCKNELISSFITLISK